eukprot:COSAG05_NODE_1870_length_3926_cov_10.367912_4_plen_141_part_00
MILKLLREHKSLSIQEVSDMTAIQTDDIIRCASLDTRAALNCDKTTIMHHGSTLQALNLIRYYEGQHIIDISNLPERLRVSACLNCALVLAALVKSSRLCMRCSHHINREQNPKEFKMVADPSKLHWTPLHAVKSGRRGV